MISCRFCVATYPGVQDRLAAELDAAGLLASPSDPEPKELDFNIMNELPVMDAVSLSLTLPSVEQCKLSAESSTATSVCPLTALSLQDWLA